jgi:hypothetical protein
MGRLSFILLVSFLTGCSMMVKTPIVANPSLPITVQPAATLRLNG